MKHIFYFLWILFIVYELIYLLTAKENFWNWKKASIYIKVFKNKMPKYSDMPDFVKHAILKFILFTIPVLIFQVVGLLSFQWFVFLCWMIFGYLVTMPLFKIFKKNHCIVFSLVVFETIVNIIIVVFIILNAYHFKLDLFNLIF